PGRREAARKSALRRHCDHQFLGQNSRPYQRATHRRERKADIHCFRRVRAGSVEIKGKMSGEIIAQTTVTIHKKGSLEGDVTARAITVEKGGMFSGQLVIGQADLTQGELLPERKAAATSAPGPGVSVAAPQPLPAT